MARIVRLSHPANENIKSYVHDSNAVRLVVGTCICLFLIHVAFVGLWLHHAHVSQDWHPLVYGYLRTPHAQISEWDYFHWIYQWTPLSIAVLGFWELIPLVQFFLNCAKLGPGDVVTVHRKPFMVLLWLAAFASLVLVGLYVVRTYIEDENQHFLFQVLLSVFWGKYTLASAAYYSQKG